MFEHLFVHEAGPEVPSALVATGFHITEDSLDAGSVVLRLTGELDMATAPRLRDALSVVFDNEPAAVTIDLADLSFMDSTGISVLLAGARRAGHGACSFELRHPRPSVAKVLRITGVERAIPIESRPLA